MTIKIAPSILAADFSYLAEQVAAAQSGGASYLHIDVMDGHFVPNISFGAVVVEKLRPHTSMVFDVHLMIENPEKYIGVFADAGADIITIHYEATNRLEECIKSIHAHEKRAGVAIKPATSEDVLLPLLGKLDLALVMSVEPGFGGQAYMPQADRKLRALRAAAGDGFDISVDGGIGMDNIAHVVEMGANVIVAGSSIFGAKDIERAVSEFNSAASRAEMTLSNTARKAGMFQRLGSFVWGKNQLDLLDLRVSEQQ